MSASQLVEEDDEFLYIKRYIHDDPDEFPSWLFDDNGEHKYSSEITEADAYAAYELELRYRIRKSNAEIIYDGIK